MPDDIILDERYMDGIEIRSFEMVIPENDPLTPEQMERMKAFIQEWRRTHPPVAYFCRMVSSTQDAITLEPTPPPEPA